MCNIICVCILQEKVPLAWVNQPLFDYKGTLRSGTATLPCWIVTPEEILGDTLNPIGNLNEHMCALQYMYIGILYMHKECPTMYIACRLFL